MSKYISNTEKNFKALEMIKDSLTPDGKIVEHTKVYKTLKKALEDLEDLKDPHAEYETKDGNYIAIRNARLNGAIDLLKAIGYEVEFNPLAEGKNPFTIKEF